MSSRDHTIKRTKIILLSLVALPFLCVAWFVATFAISNFPFSSSIVAQTATLSGYDICVVQTFKDLEPYQVSYYARRAGGPWVWHYLAHQDDRWRSCRVEVSGDTLRIYRGSTLR